MNKYSGILLSTFIHVSTIFRFLYTVYDLFFINVQLEKKEILLIIGTALNIKPTWASHIPTEDPEKARPTAQPPAPAQPGSRMVPAKRNPAPSAPVGSAGHAGPRPLHRKCPLPPSPACRGQVLPEGKWQRGMCVSGKEKRDGSNVLFD